MRRILFSLIIIIALLGNINIADAQYAHPGTAIKTNDGNVQSDITTMKSNIASSTAEIQAIRDNLNTHETEIANATAEISALRTNDQTQETRIASNEVALLLHVSKANAMNSSGRLSGGIFTHDGSFGVNYTTMEVALKTRDSQEAELAYYLIPAGNVSGASLTLNHTSYIYLDYNNGSPQILVTTDRDTIRTTDQLDLVRVFKNNTTTYVGAQGFNSANFARREHERTYARGVAERFDGALIAEKATRYVTITASTWYVGTSLITKAASDSQINGFEHYFSYNANTDTWTDNVATYPNQIDNTKYNDTSDGSLKDLSNNQYGVHWIYLGGGEKISVVFGHNTYKLSEAIEVQPPMTLPNYLAEFGVLVGKIIIKKNNSVFTSIDSAFETIFATGVVEHNDTLNRDAADAHPSSSITYTDNNNLGVITAQDALDTLAVLLNTKADSDEIHTDISQAYVNVKEFGAVGDGIVDDAAAINSAIASLTSGGVVLFPSGYYCIKSQITLTSKHGLTLRGVGHGENTTYLGTNIYATGYNGHHFRGIDCVGVSIENMNLTAEGQDSSFAVGGIYFSISSNSNNPYHTFKDLFISDISNSGISIGTPIMTNFNNVTVRKCVGSSFNLWSGTSTTWTNCYANNATEAGWLLTGMTYCTLQGCAAESAGVGYYFDNSKSISVMGCGTEAIINRGGAFNGYAYRSINGSNAITLYDCYDRISETGTFSESAGGLLDYINHKTDSNAQITKLHSLPASSSVYTDTYNMGATNLQTVLDTVAVWLNSAELRLDSIETVFAVGVTGEVLTRTNDGFRWATIPSGVTDHLLLSNIGTKTHLELEQDILDLQANPAGISRVYINGVALPTGEVEFKSGTNITLNVTGSTVEIAAIGGGGTGATVETILNQNYVARSQGTAESGLYSIYDFDITSSIIVTDTVVPTINGLVQYETTHFAISTWDDGGTNKLRITFANDVSADALVRVSCFTTLPLLAVISADNVSTTNGWLQDDLDSFENGINTVDSINDSQDIQIEKNRVAITNTYTKAQTESTVAVMIKDNAQAKYWYPANMANGDFTGEVLIATVASSQTQYYAVYMSSSGLAAADSDAYATLPALGVILETGTGDKKVLVKGLVRNDSWNWTVGGRVYVSGSAGQLTQTAPTTAGTMINIIGIAVHADILYVCPSTTVVEN